MRLRLHELNKRYMTHMGQNKKRGQEKGTDLFYEL